MVMGKVHHLGNVHDNMVWVTAAEEGPEGSHRIIVKKMGKGEFVDVDTDMGFIGKGEDGDRDVFIIRGENGEIDIEALKNEFGEDCEMIHTADGKRIMKWVSGGDGGQPVIVKRMGHGGGGDFVHYRCEETGSMLTVKADENLLDDYVDPVTGCVMTKVENAGVRVITIREEIVTEDEDE
jgi:hypothetical protein